MNKSLQYSKQSPQLLKTLKEEESESEDVSTTNNLKTAKASLYTAPGDTTFESLLSESTYSHQLSNIKHDFDFGEDNVNENLLVFY